MAITANSKPKYGIFGGWDCSHWLKWHQALKAEFGLGEANKRFVPAWNKQSFWSWNYSFCKYDNAWSKYFYNQGLDPENWVASSVNNVKDTVETVTETASQLATLKWIVGLIFGLFILWAVKEEFF